MRPSLSRAALLAGICGTLTAAFASPRPKLILVGKSTHTDGQYYNYNIEHRLGVHLAKGNASRLAFGTNDIANDFRVYVWTRSTGCVTEVPPIFHDELDTCTPEGRDRQLLGGISADGEYVVGMSEGDFSIAGAFRWEFGNTYADDLAAPLALWNERAVGVGVGGNKVAMGGDFIDACGAPSLLASRLNTSLSSESIIPKSIWNCENHPAHWVIPAACTSDVSTIVGRASIFLCCISVPDGCVASALPWRWDIGSNPEIIRLDSELVSGATLGISNSADTAVGSFHIPSPAGPMFYTSRDVAFRATSGGSAGEILQDIPIDVSGIGGCYTNDYGVNSCINSYAADSNDDWTVGEVNLNAVAWVGENAEPINLNDRFACLKPANLALISATSISDDGRFIAGHARYASQSQDWAWIVDQGSCPADFNEDGVVDDSDFTYFFAPAYTQLECTPCTATCSGENCMQPGLNDCTTFENSSYEACIGDLNWDGLVDDADFVFFTVAYTNLLCPED